jgi:tetratricopeptide (TPR) repeat protein
MEGYALLGMGAARILQDPSASFEVLSQVLALARETGDKSMEAIAHLLLGVATTTMRDVDAAVAHLEGSVALYADIDNQRQEGSAAWLLGCAYELRGELDQAIAAMERAAERQGMRDARNTRARIAEIRTRLTAAQ